MLSTGSSKDKIDQELTSSAIEILNCHLHQLSDAEPKSKAEAISDGDEEFDSQGLECDPDWAKEMQFMDDYLHVRFTPFRVSHFAGLTLSAA